MSNRFTERKQLQKRILHQRIAFAVLFIGFISLVVLGIVGLVKLIQKPSVEETMVASDDDMQMLIDLKEMMEQKELTIILDAGHGGNDVGTGDESYSQNNPLREYKNEGYAFILRSKRIVNQRRR